MTAETKFSIDEEKTGNAFVARPAMLVSCNIVLEQLDRIAEMSCFRSGHEKIHFMFHFCLRASLEHPFTHRQASRKREVLINSFIFIFLLRIHPNILGSTIQFDFMFHRIRVTPSGDMKTITFAYTLA